MDQNTHTGDKGIVLSENEAMQRIKDQLDKGHRAQTIDKENLFLVFLDKNNQETKQQYSH